MKTQYPKHLRNNNTLGTNFLTIWDAKVTDGGPLFNTEFQDFAKT